MKVKKSALIILILTAIMALTLFFATACTQSVDYSQWEGPVVVFELEGGTYKNSNAAIINYYQKLEDGETIRIRDPESYSGKKIERSGYTLEGWYKTRRDEGGVVVYSDEWDFDSDEIDNSGVTLYAHWKRDVEYTYVVCYVNESGEEVTLGTYDADEGQLFNDYSSYARSRTGYTSIGYYDENGNPWDSNFRHPGGEEATAIKVFVKYIEGNYAVVTTARELSRNLTSNIYLMNDIDFEGDTFNFNGYNKIFLGNGHTISNFTISYDATRSGLIEDNDLGGSNILSISLFGDLEGATVQDVTFKGVKIDLTTRLSLTRMIYIAPLSVKVTNSVISNVHFEGIYTISQLPSDFDTSNLIIETENLFYHKPSGDRTEAKDCSVKFTEEVAEI